MRLFPPHPTGRAACPTAPTPPRHRQNPCSPAASACGKVCTTMDVLPKPDVILTHESDLDGLVAGVLLQRLAKKLFGTDVRLEAYHYHNWKQRELRERAAWVTDFNFEARLDRPDWVVIDHHATEAPAKSAHLIHDLNKSAGLLCYELCKEAELGSPELDRLVHLNNVADLFLEDDGDFFLANVS